MRVDVYHHVIDDGVQSTLDAILTALTSLTGAVFQMQRSVEPMSKELDDLTAKVAHNTEVEQSAITLIQEMAAQIAAVKDDPAAIAALAAQLDAQASALAAAVAANTPAAPAPSDTVTGGEGSDTTPASTGADTTSGGDSTDVTTTA